MFEQVVLLTRATVIITIVIDKLADASRRLCQVHMEARKRLQGQSSRAIL